MLQFKLLPFVSLITPHFLFFFSGMLSPVPHNLKTRSFRRDSKLGEKTNTDAVMSFVFLHRWFHRTCTYRCVSSRVSFAFRISWCVSSASIDMFNKIRWRLKPLNCWVLNILYILYIIDCAFLNTYLFNKKLNIFKFIYITKKQSKLTLILILILTLMLLNRLNGVQKGWIELETGSAEEVSPVMIFSPTFTCLSSLFHMHLISNLYRSIL